MIDWFSGYIGYDASGLKLGRVIELGQGGELLRERDTWATARGSYEAGIQITRAAPTEQMIHARDRLGFQCSDTSVLKVSGNPTKFLQGHNAAGPSVSQLGPMLRAMARAFGEGFKPGGCDEETLPAVHRSRVDVTTAFDLDSHQTVHDFLRHIESHGRSRHGRAIDSKGTVYFGKHSTRWSIKFYCKHCELLANPPEVPKPLLDELLQWTRHHLRCELTLRRPELKNRGTLHESIIWEFLQRLEISNMAPKSEPIDASLPTGARAALRLWYDGTDLASFYPRNTYYRHRRAILKATGIDVALPRREQSEDAKAALISLDELRKREVTTVPAGLIQRSLFGAQ